VKTIVSKKYRNLFKVSCDGGKSWGISAESYDEAHARAEHLAAPYIRKLREQEQRAKEERRAEQRRLDSPFAVLAPAPVRPRFVRETDTSRNWNRYSRGRKRAAR
jgi:hypothetical protein